MKRQWEMGKGAIEVYIRNGKFTAGYAFRTNSWVGVFAGIGPSLRITKVRVRGGRVIAYAQKD